MDLIFVFYSAGLYRLFCYHKLLCNQNRIKFSGHCCTPFNHFVELRIDLLSPNLSCFQILLSELILKLYQVKYYHISTCRFAGLT